MKQERDDLPKTEEERLDDFFRSERRKMFNLRMNNKLGDYSFEKVERIKSQAIIDRISLDVSGSECVIGYQVDGFNQYRQVIQAFVYIFIRHLIPPGSDWLCKEFVYKVCDCYKDVTERILNPEPGEKLVNSLCELDLLIIYSPRMPIKNSSKWSYCLGVAESRRFSQKKTVFITFKPEPEVDDKVKIVKLSDLLEKGSDEREIK